MDKYNVLVYGSGAREHALADKIFESPLLKKLFLALPNDGFKMLGEEIIFSDFCDLAKKCVKNSIDIVVVGPELPLAHGLVDVLQKNNIKCVGANQFWTQLESSKKFAKDFMKKYSLPTAKYIVVDAKNNTLDLKKTFSTPPVVKADGLAAGKGVCVCESFAEAENSVAEFLKGKFGDASKTVIVEEKLDGEEISLLALFDGKTLLPLVPARDYKKAFDGNQGLNTGGMGAFCPVHLDENKEAQLQAFLKSLEAALKKEKADFCGVIYSGLILTKSGVQVLEFNMRFGDPETQALLTHLETDILEIFVKMTQKKLSDVQLKWKNGKSICVVLAAKGYPEHPELGESISGLNNLTKSKIFFAGVKKENQKLITFGGRVLSLCLNAESISAARENVYLDVLKIEYNTKSFRTDIGL